MIIPEEGETSRKGMKLGNILFDIVGIYYNEHYCFHNLKSNKVWKIETASFKAI